MLVVRISQASDMDFIRVIIKHLLDELSRMNHIGGYSIEDVDIT